MVGVAEGATRFLPMCASSSASPSVWARARPAQKRDPDLAVLLMSGFAPELLEADTDQQLPSEFLRKPSTREELARALARALAPSGR